MALLTRQRGFLIAPCIALVAALLCARTSSASAQSHEGAGALDLALAVDPCVAVDVAVVRAIVATELGARLVDEGGGDARSTVRVGVTCEPRGVRIEVHDPVTGKSLERLVALEREAPIARPRLLALAISELVEASWIELEVTPAPAIASPDATAHPSARRAAHRVAARALEREHPPPWRALVLACGATHGRPVALGVGGGLRVSRALDRSVGMSLAARATQATHTSDLGDVRSLVVAGSLAVEVLARTGAFALAGGGGVRLGVAHLAGEAAMPELVQSGDVVGLVGGPVLEGGVSFEGLTPIVVGLFVEGTYTVSPVSGRVAGERAVAVEGPAVAIDLGIGVAL